MMGRPQRIITIVFILLQNNEVRTSNLMDRFGRCRQTILNDIYAINEIIPVEYNKDKQVHELSEFNDPYWQKLVNTLMSKIS